MDTRGTVQDLLRDAFSICESRGPTMALRSLERFPSERVESSEYLRGLFDAYRSASAAEKSKMRRAAEDLAGIGCCTPKRFSVLFGNTKKRIWFEGEFFEWQAWRYSWAVSKIRSCYACSKSCFVCLF